MDPATGVQLGLGALGMLGGKKDKKKADFAAGRAQRATERVLNLQWDTLQKIFGVADSYDPAKATDAAVGYASDRAGQSFERSLKNIRAHYGGGNPSGDTNFHISGQRAANDAFDPLKMFAADAKANEPFNKVKLLSTVLGVPAGSLTDGYFKAAAMQPGGGAGGAMMMSQALQRLFGGGGAQDNSLSSQANAFPGFENFGVA